MRRRALLVFLLCAGCFESSGAMDGGGVDARVDVGLTDGAVSPDAPDAALGRLDEPYEQFWAAACAIEERCMTGMECLRIAPEDLACAEQLAVDAGEVEAVQGWFDDLRAAQAQVGLCIDRRGCEELAICRTVGAPGPPDSWRSAHEICFGR